jgi:hypothetical protein
MTDKIITQEYLKELFDYKDGNLYWKVKLSNAIKINSKAGKIKNNGYFSTLINKKSYLNHRLIFLHQNGYLPKMIDHIDGNPLNNKIENLREANRYTNGYNSKLYENNTSGVKNVCWNKNNNNWLVRICVEKKVITIGSFKNLELAKKSAEDARKKYHQEFAREF